MSLQSGKKFLQEELVDQMLNFTEQSENSLKTAAKAQRAVMLTEGNWKNLIESNQAIIMSQSQLALILKELATKTDLKDYIAKNERYYYNQYTKVHNTLDQYIKDFKDAETEMENAKSQTADDIKKTLKDAILTAGREKDNISYELEKLKSKLI